MPFIDALSVMPEGTAFDAVKGKLESFARCDRVTPEIIKDILLKLVEWLQSGPLQGLPWSGM
jgi:hypothetical protein